MTTTPFWARLSVEKCTHKSVGSYWSTRRTFSSCNLQIINHQWVSSYLLDSQFPAPVQKMLIINQLFGPSFWVNESTSSLYKASEVRRFLLSSRRTYFSPILWTLISNQLQLPDLHCVADEGTSSLNEVTQNGSYFLRYTTLFFHGSSQNTYF